MNRNAMPENLLDGSPAQVRDGSALPAVVSQLDRVLGLVLELTPAIVRVVDVSGRIVRTNEPAPASVTPLPATIREMWERDQPHRAQEESVLAFLDMPSMRALGGVATRGVRLVISGRVPNESVIIERSAVPVFDNDGKVVCAVVVDQVIGPAGQRNAALTQRLVAEASLQQPQSDAPSAKGQKSGSTQGETASEGRQVSDLIHDVNNALNTIMAAAFLAQHRADSPEAIRDYAGRIQKAAESGAKSAALVERIIREAPKSEAKVPSDAAVNREPQETVSTEASKKAGPLDILLVEDNPDGREFIGRLLRTAGHRVDAVATAAEARARLDRISSSQVVDLLLTDLDLPDGNGWELAAYARRQRSSLRVGVISGWDVNIGGDEAADAEFVLRKPLRAAVLLDHVAGRQARDLPE